MAEVTTRTPAGHVVTFEDGLPDPDTGKSKRRSYTVDGEKLPSVTTVLGCLDKPGLKYAAEKLAVAGVIELAREGALPMHPEGALTAMKSRGLRFWQVWGSKADRGTVTHEDLLAMATGQELRELASYPAEQQGFIRGASAWYADYRPEAIDSETFVVSLEHGFAGRYDLCARFPTLGGRVGRVDFKTTEALPRYKGGAVKAPYEEMLFQLGAYELAAVESGYEPSDFQAVVRIDSTGAYDMTASWIAPNEFLAVLGAYRALRGVSSNKPKAVAA